MYFPKKSEVEGKAVNVAELVRGCITRWQESDKQQLLMCSRGLSEAMQQQVKA